MTISRSPWPSACDSHMHVYEDAYPLAPTATFKPPHAPASAYRAVQRELGLARTVVIQPTGYGLDNRCTMAAVAALGPEARAVVVVAPDVAPAELRSLHDLGARGVRYMMLPGGVLPWSGLERTAAAIAPLGWHIDLQLDGRELPLHEAMLSAPALPPGDRPRRPIHGPGRARQRTAARPLPAARQRHDAGSSSRRPYESSRSGPPGYDDIAWIARWSRAATPSGACGRATGRTRTRTRRRRTRRCSTGASASAPMRRRSAGARRQPGRAVRLRAVAAT
jgi:D-galactarolactone isomerase